MLICSFVGVDETSHDYWESLLHVGFDQFGDDVVVQKHERSFSCLEVQFLSSLNEPLKKFKAKLVKLLFSFNPYDVNDLIDFIYKYHLLGWARDGPVLQQTLNQLYAKVLVLLYKVFHASL